MEFFDKKQDVIDIELTSYGKQLLSRGKFKPSYYAFSDDGVLYDQRWVSGTVIQEPQSQAEPRIQEDTPRLKTQYRKEGAERAVFNMMSYDKFTLMHNIIDLFEIGSEKEYIELIKNNVDDWHPQFAESEKLLENKLGTKTFLNNYNPAWNALLYNGTISDSTSYYKKNDITTLIPQLNCTLTDTVYLMNPDIDPGTISQIKNIAALAKTDYNTLLGAEDLDSAGAFANNYFYNTDLEDGKILIIKDFLFASIEESNSEFTNDNFTIEVFEITTKDKGGDGEEALVKLVFADESEIDITKPPGFQLNAVEHVFDIDVDTEIEETFACALIGKDKKIKNQSIYVSNIFDCNTISDDELGVTDQYTILPPVDAGDVC
jgi:hypothetical protein